ncbi:MAG: (Fe-S)-binding protein [Myxococcales bacterium]|nr:(Fe-S)-binding protein [Myxococcales bacterium]
MEMLDYGYRMLFGALLLLVGGGIFSWTMYVRIRLLLAGKPEKRWDLLADRAGRLLKIAIGQRKMFKEPASGILHALTFWGFCVLSIRTTLLFVNAFAPDFFLPGVLHPIYDFSKDITEVIVLVAIAGFFYRRLVVQPARIHYSNEALVILSFIGGLMITDFLYDGLHFGGMAKAALGAGNTAEAQAILAKIAHAPVGSALAGYFSASDFDPKTMQMVGEANYWLHLSIILTFMNLLPISKHFHVITALPNVFLSRLEPKGALTLIDNIEDRIIAEESLGLGRVEDLTWKQTMDLYTCTECGRCTVNCPAWNTDKPLNPALIIKDLQAHLYDEKDRILAGGAAPAAEEGAIPPLIAGVNPDAIWSCTTCRSCSEQCPVMIEHVDKIVDMRRHMMLNLNQFPAELKVTLKNLENKSNPWGISSAKRGAWAKKRPDVPDLKSNPDAEWLYFVGCAGAYDDRAKKVTEAVVKILNAAGTDFAIIGKKEKCSGDPARRMGHEYLFQEQATANIEQMNKAGVKKVIASCPHCFNSIKNEYPQLGGHFEVVHHTQLIWRLVREGKLDLKSAAQMKITFHDSCYLGRYNDEYDAPREALAAVPGVELVEMERSKQTGMCCGAGGARMYMEEKIGTRVNQLRVEQAMETKPEVIAVSCPFCLTMVKDGLREKDIEGVETKDVAEIIADALVEPTPEPEPEAETPAAEPAAVPAAPKD